MMMDVQRQFDIPIQNENMLMWYKYLPLFVLDRQAKPEF